MGIIGPILVNAYKHLKIVQMPAILKTLSTSIWEPTEPKMCPTTNPTYEYVPHGLSTMQMDPCIPLQ
jgi:hypothetical protein